MLLGTSLPSIFSTRDLKIQHRYDLVLVVKTISLKSPRRGARGFGMRASHNLVGHGQRLADVVQHQIRVDALRRGVVDQLRGPHELLPHQLMFGFWG